MSPAQSASLFIAAFGASTRVRTEKPLRWQRSALPIGATLANYFVLPEGLEPSSYSP